MSSTRPWGRLRPTVIVAVVSLALTSLTTLAGLREAGASESVPTAGSQKYTTRGVVKSFGPEKKYVNIAHEDIAGYMNAMTMSFEPRLPSQIAGLAAGDKVRFTFTTTDEGRRMIDVLEKE